MQVDPSLVSDLLQEGMAKGAIPFVTVVSGSMAPLLLKDDQVGLQNISAEDLKPGDIIIYRTAQTLMTHRYWGQTDQGHVSRGDRPLSFDSLWSSDQLVGKVIVRRRSGRELALTTGLGRLINSYLTQLARLESYLFAGFSLNPLNTTSNRWLGRRLKSNRHNLIVRLVRRTLLIMAQVPVAVINFLGQT